MILASFWGAPGCSWVLLVLLGPGVLVGAPGTPGVLLGAPGDPYKRRRIVTGQKVRYNDPPKQ